MTIRLSPAAHDRISSFLRARPDALAMRFGVKRTGCSGYAYVIDLTDAVTADDTIFEQDGVKLVVDPQSLPLVEGTEIDFAQHGLGSAFVFRNPKVTAECGCGESFTIA